MMSRLLLRCGPLSPRAGSVDHRYVEGRPPVMYEAFDDFLRVRTWHKRHPEDDERFFCALDRVVHQPQFNADSLGEYMDQKRQNGEAAQANLVAEYYEDARDHYVAAAWAVRGYLRVAGQAQTRR
jgi:hypothetical protein